MKAMDTMAKCDKCEKLFPFNELVMGDNGKELCNDCYKPKKMKSKIGRIESVYDLYDGDRNVDANKLKDVLNDIIDYLNSQSQPEEKKTLEQIRGEFDKERVKEWDRTAMETYKQATQDNPEEWEEDEGLYQRINDILSYSPTRWNTELLKLFKQLLKDKDKKIRELEEDIFNMRCERDEED